MTNAVAPLREFGVDQLAVAVYESTESLGQAAANAARMYIQSAVQLRGMANIILATGNSQLAFLHALRELSDIDWHKVTVFSHG